MSPTSHSALVLSDADASGEEGSAAGGWVFARQVRLLAPEWWLQLLILALVVAFGVSTFVVHRPASGYNSIWDGWVYTFAESLPVIPVLLRVRRSSRLRSAWLAIAVGIALITIGNLVWTYHDQNLHPIPDPAPSDAIYLVAYAALIVGVAIFTQTSFGRVHPSVRLDGAISGLAIGAVVGMLWFEPLLRAIGHPLEIAVNMAYPSCDLVLIVLLVAGLAPHRYRPNWATVLLMVGVTWFVVGDVVTMNRIAANTYVPGTPLDVTWPIGIFCMGLAASIRDRRRSGGSRASLSSPAGLTAVPVLFGLVSLGVLAASLVRHDSSVVLGVAIAANVVVIVRMWMTLREVRQSVANYQDARTDYLTGLPNRRAFSRASRVNLLQRRLLRGEGRCSARRPQRFQGGQRRARPRCGRRTSLCGRKTVRAQTV